MKVINALLTSILGSSKKFAHEDKLIILYSLFSGVCSGLGIAANSKLNFSSFDIYLVSFSFLIYMFNYISARFYKKLRLAKWMFSIYTFLFCNCYWLVNFGSRGSAMYLFLAYLSIMIFIWNNRQIFIITLLVLVNIIILFLLEINNPWIVPPYPTEHARILDSYSFLLMFVGIFSILVVTAKNNYIRQYKRAQQSDALKSAFLANMSHEIRTPLNAVMGFSSLLSKRELTKEKKEIYANLITENSNNLMQIVSDILDSSMIESGQLNIKVKPVEINELLKNIHLNFKQLLIHKNKKDIKLLTDFALNSIVLNIDGTRLNQIITNLIDNSIKFTTEGFIKFGYYIEEPNIIFYVEDTGRGIKEEFQPLIFTRFAKQESTEEDFYLRGAGIGLSLSKEIVEILGGKIWYTSRYLEGSIFYFSFPINNEL